MTAFEKTGYGETNPYRPDLPEDLRGISPNLYDFLRETAETLREQHNLTQAGDSTFSWEILTEVDLKPRYNVGSLGRFYHPNYGVIHARYCRISEFKSTEWLGAPVGLRVDGDPLKWSVTNDMSKSNPDLVVGLGGWFVLPPADSCGWVIVNGVNIQSLAIRKQTDLEQFDKFVWGATDQAQDAKAAPGRVFGSVLGVSADVEEVIGTDSPYRIWNVPPGFAFVDQQADSEKRIRDWIGEAVDGAVDQIVALQSQVNQLLGSGGIGELTVRIGAAEKTIAEHTTLITRQSALTAQNFLTLNDRVTNLEQRTSTGGGGSGAGTIRTDLNNLTNEFNKYRNTTNGQCDILRTQMNEVLSITSGLPGELESIRSEFNGIGDRITDLRLWNLADVPDDYTGEGNKFLQILADESGATYTALTAGIVGFTPTGSLSSTDVQATLAELDAEKVHRVTSADNALTRFDGTNGAIQNSGVLLDDSNNISNVASLSVADDAYNGAWNGSTLVPTKDAVYDKIESVVTSIAAKLTGVALTNSAALIPSINSPWINYGGGFGGVRYYKSADGVVHIEGLIQAAGGSPTSGVVLFTLLAGYRPPDTLMFGPWSGGGACRIDVQANGDVVMQSGNTAFTSLSGISFIPA